MHRRFSGLAVGALLLVTACRDAGTEPKQSPDFVAASVSDAVSGHLSDRNPYFFWLTPLRPSPPDDQFGEFEALASPRVEVVCLDSTQPGCDDETPLVVFTRESGLAVEVDHFKAVLPMRGLRLTSRTDVTTYRVLVWTDPLTDFGGPFLLGFADFRVVKATDPAKSLPDGITLVQDGRTLPIRFRIDRGAYEHELAVNFAEGSLDPEGEAFCQENCSVTIIPPDQETVAALADDDMNVTAIRFQPGDVAAMSVLVIDERLADGAGENCADGVTVAKKYCYRYRITPDVEFENPVPFGICPREIPLDETSPWRILKVDYDAAGKPIVTYPPETDVSDFLPCTVPAGIGLLQKVLRYAGNWLAPPVHALAGTSRPWGGTAKDLSDLFWAEDAELEAVSPLTDTAAAGAVVPITVRVVATQLGTGLSGQQVTFTASSRGTVSASTVITDFKGEATVNWSPAPGLDSLTVDASLVRGGPITFTRSLNTGVTLSGLVFTHAAMQTCSSGRLPCGSTYSFVLTNSTGARIGPAIGAGGYPRIVLKKWTAWGSSRLAAGTSVLEGCGGTGALDSGRCSLPAWPGGGPDSIQPMGGEGRITAVVQAVLEDGAGGQAVLAEASTPIMLTDCESLIAFRSGRDGNEEIYVMNPDGTGQRRLTVDSDRDLMPAWAPGGPTLAFSSNRGGNWDIYTMFHTNGPATYAWNLTDSPANEFGATWSPDSTRIAFTIDAQIWVMDTDGLNRRNLTSDPTLFDDYAAWSPDGTRLAFTGSVAGVPDIYVMNADGSNRVQLTNNNGTGAWDEMPAWSPDGFWIAFLSSRDYPGTPTSSPDELDLYIMRSDGTEVVRLTEGAHLFPVPPSWSPRGEEIAYSANGRIYAINRHSGNVRQLTDGSTYDVEPAWLICGF